MQQKKKHLNTLTCVLLIWGVPSFQWRWVKGHILEYATEGYDFSLELRFVKVHFTDISIGLPKTIYFPFVYAKILFLFLSIFIGLPAKCNYVCFMSLMEKRDY